MEQRRQAISALGKAPSSLRTERLGAVAVEKIYTPDLTVDAHYQVCNLTGSHIPRRLKLFAQASNIDSPWNLRVSSRLPAIQSPAPGLPENLFPNPPGVPRTTVVRSPMDLSRSTQPVTLFVSRCKFKEATRLGCELDLYEIRSLVSMVGGF